MNQVIKRLALLLLAQLVILAWVFWPQPEIDFEAAQSTLISEDLAQADQLLISEADNALLIKQSVERWIMPDYHGLPADTDKLDTALLNLPKLTRGYPVADSSSARERFEVSADNAQKTVSYFEGEKELARVFLGTSPGFRQVHVAVDDAEEVYSISFNSFDLPTDPVEWLDKRLLALPGVNGLENLRVIAAADIATAAILADTEVPPTRSVETDTGVYEYRLYQIDEEYFVKRDDIDVFFSISQLDFDRANPAAEPATPSADEAALEQQQSEDDAASQNSTSSP